MACYGAQSPERRPRKSRFCTDERRVSCDVRPEATRRSARPFILAFSRAKRDACRCAAVTAGVTTCTRTQVKNRCHCTPTRRGRAPPHAPHAQARERGGDHAPHTRKLRAQATKASVQPSKERSAMRIWRSPFRLYAKQYTLSHTDTPRISRACPASRAHAPQAPQPVSGERCRSRSARPTHALAASLSRDRCRCCAPPGRTASPPPRMPSNAPRGLWRRASAATAPRRQPRSPPATFCSCLPSPPPPSLRHARAPWRGGRHIITTA